MDFGFSDEEVAFREKVRQFLKKELPPNWVGPELEDLFSSEVAWQVFREMARKLGAQGWLSLGWPKEYGGLGRSRIEQNILWEEMAYHRAPGLDGFGVKMLAPTLMLFGTEEQKKEHLGPIARGEVIWCQCFSEPEAGSDLSSLQTRAVEEADCFVINGEKVWISGAHHADWCNLLARTDPQAPKRQGISFFLVNMSAPGVEVRPLPNIVGKHSFNQVFFNNVKVPRSNLVGGKNNGWLMANALLSAERSAIEMVASGRRTLDDLLAFVTETKLGARLLAQNRVIRRRLSELVIEVEVARLLTYRVAWMQDQGVRCDSESALSKVVNSEVLQRIAGTAMQLMGLYGVLEPGSKRAPLNGIVAQKYFGALSWTIGGGTSEILRTLIATRGLGLPRS